MTHLDRRASQFENPVSVDRRSLAAFRISTALCVLIDLLERLPDLGAFYSDGGVIPRAELLAWFGDNYARPISLALSGGSTESQAALFACTALAALAMLVGYRTRVATVVCWLLLSSIQLRNPFVVFGAGVFLRLLLFWGCFLPLADRFSVDRALQGEHARQIGGRYFSAAALALQIQVCLVFVIAGLAKMANPVWADGLGVTYSLDYELLTTAFGQVLRAFPTICMVLSYAVVALELVGPALLFIPWHIGPIRTAVLAALFCMLIGFSMVLRVGLFPFVSMAGLAIFIPGWFWDLFTPRWQSARAVGRVSRRWNDALVMLQRLRLIRPSPWRGTSHPVWRGVRELFVLWALAYVIVWNVGLWRDAGYTAPAPLAWLGETFHLRQRWGMFTRLPSTGWFLIQGRLRDGTEVDLFQAGGALPTYEQARRPPPMQPPARVSATFRSVPWSMFFLSLSEPGQIPSGQFQGYGRYLCRGWNRREPEERELVGFELIYMWRPVVAQLHASPPGDYQRAVLWTHNCFG